MYFYVSFDVPFGVPFDPAFSPGLEALWLSICITNRLHPKNLTNLFTATAGVSTEGMPAGTDANAGGTVGDASKLGISAPAAEFVIAEGAQVQEKLRLVLQTRTSNSYHDAGCLYTEGSCRWS